MRRKEVTCRNCQVGSLRPHCGNPQCRWFACDLCEIVLDPKRGRVLPRQRSKG